MAFEPKRFMMKVQGGREYLPVSARLIWFREEHPDWGILTDAHTIDLDNQIAVFRATIVDADNKIMATATKAESVKGFADYIEKAETGAVGRALAYCGFGTQFAPELEEGEQRLADAPQPQRYKQTPHEGGREPAPRSFQRPPDRRPEPIDDDPRLPGAYVPIADPSLSDPFEEPQVDPEKQALIDARMRFTNALLKAGFPLGDNTIPAAERKKYSRWALEGIFGPGVNGNNLPAARWNYAAEEVEKGKRPALLSNFQAALAAGEFKEGAADERDSG